MDGADLDCALRSRERWLELGRRAGIDIHQAGTLMVARAEDELNLLETVAAHGPRGGRMLSAVQAGALAPIPTAELVGAMHATLDLRVDPRSAVVQLAAMLEADPGASVIWRSPVDAIEPGAVHAAGITVRAPLIVVCPGPAYGGLPSQLRAGLDVLTRCRLQMLRVAAPGGRRYGPALSTGLSLIRYPAFATQPAAAALRERLTRERPELVEAGIHLVVTQLPGGDLIVGDTHLYGDTLSPFGDERLDELLLAEARRLLGARELTVRERWHGIYASTPGGHFLTTAPCDGVRVVEVISGLGMTMSFGQAGATLDALAGDAAVVA
jgi:FAD dependent oxidoreductase TIGR03364